MKYRINKMSGGKNDTRYYIACSIRNKKRVSTKNIKSLGKLSELSKLYDDVDAYLKEQLDLFNSELEGLITVKLNPEKTITPDHTGTVYGGSIFIKRVLDSMKMDTLLNKIASKYKFQYSLKDILYFITSTRILTPDSKYGMFKKFASKQLEDYEFSKDSIYRAMDILLENKDLILKHCFDNEPVNIQRNKKILYYDCTNTYFESEFEDDLRARGHGKRNEIEPLVSLGLIMDGSGIPLSYTVFKGSTNEQGTLIPLEQEIIKVFKQATFVMITDAGLSSKTNRAFNGLNNRKFITTLPIRKMSKDKLNLYIFDEKNPWISSDSRYNSPAKIIDRYEELSELLAEDSMNGNRTDELMAELLNLQQLVIYRRYKVLQDKLPKKYIENESEEFIDEDYLISFSLKYYLRQRKQRRKVVDKARKMLTNKGKLKASKSSDPKFYISEMKVKSDSGEIFDDYREINTALIEEQEKLDGYYCVTTNLYEDDNETIINAMKYRWFIEDSFRIMKQEFEFRPVNHSKQERIKCHFFTCFLSLLVYRYIQKYCHESKEESLQNISDERILEILRGYNLSKIKKDLLVPAFNYNESIKAFEELFNVGLSKEIITPSKVKKELRKQISK